MKYVAKLNLALSIVCIDVHDWQKMVAFYQNVLEFEPVVLEPHHRYGWLQCGPALLALRGVDDLAVSPASRISLQFEVADIESSINALEEEGCVFYEKQLETEEGYKIAYFHDPEGNALAIYHDG